MTRKRRKTRSRQERRRIHARTRQKFGQLYRRHLEASYEDVINPGVHPLVAWMRKRDALVSGTAATP